MKNTFLKLGVIVFAIFALAAGVSVLAAGVSALTVTKSDSAGTFVKSTVSASATNQTSQTSNKATQVNQVSQTAQIVLANNVAEGTFGANTGGGNYIFPGGVAAYNFDAKGGITLGTEGLPTEIAFTYADSAPAIRAEAGAIKFIRGGNYIFDNNVKTVGSIKANDYFAGNGSQGISRKVSVKGSNSQNCSLTFTDGLLTATTCPTN